MTNKKLIRLLAGLSKIAGQLNEVARALFKLHDDQTAPRPPIGKCETCIFADFSMGQKKGLCRRNAPSVVVVPKGVTWETDESVFPEISLIDWCGEYRIANR